MEGIITCSVCGQYLTDTEFENGDIGYFDVDERILNKPPVRLYYHLDACSSPGNGSAF